VDKKREGEVEWRKGGRTQMKVKITVEIENADGSLATESTRVEAEVPDFEAYSGPEKFGEEFDEYERKVIKLRNEAVQAATEKYVSELAKKKASWRQRREKEN
jgi:hypothetical protein